MLLQQMASTGDTSVYSSVAVVGLGKIGLPLAAQFARNGLRVVGCDVIPGVVDTINSGHSHIHEEPGLEEAVASAVQAGTLRATLDTAAAVAESDAVVVIVPLLIGADHSMEFHNLDSATRAVAGGLRPGTTVIFETTLPVGTTRQRLVPMLEKNSGLRAGPDFHVAFSPERVYAGRVFDDLREYPKIVGGIDAASTDRAVAFYRTALDAEVWPVENSETAEFAKLAETTYRDVNIALANQLALYGASRDVNVAEAFRASNSQPFSHIHRPGIGVGGHCIPVYPHFLLGDAGLDELSIVRIGRQTNDHMAEACVDQLKDALGGLESRTVLVLGAAYREDVKELAFSTAILIVDLLRRSGAKVLINDPLYAPEELAALEADFVELDSDSALSAEAVIVQAWHHEYGSVDWRRFKHLRVVLDGRGAVDAASVQAAGAIYIAVGSRRAGAAAPK